MAGGNAGGAERLIAKIKAAYWLALMIIVAMVLAAYVMLQSMMADHRRYEEVIALIGSQKALSQRIVFLANAATLREPERTGPLVGLLRDATRQFETNNAWLAQWVDSVDAPQIKEIFYQQPFHLEFFSLNLVANAQRLIASLETMLGLRRSDGVYVGGRERAHLDESGANATLNGFEALETELQKQSRAGLDDMLKFHRYLFLATIGVICMIALFIFSPMAELIRRRTTQLVEARNAMAYLAVHDGLTGLYNRSFMREKFTNLIDETLSRDKQLAVVQLDLDRFKQINDTLGHAAGDYVLATTARRLKASCRPSDVCARLGGDEFLIVLPDAGTRSDIEGFVRRVLDRVNEPIVYKGSTIFSRASAGVAICPPDGIDPTVLVVHADLALYAAKKNGGSSVEFFSDELRQDLEHRRLLEADLIEAIAAEAFEVYFQPQVSLSTGRTTGVEALVRWRHPKRGIVSPGEFIPVAERAGIMHSIGRIIMKKAIGEAANWYRSGIEFGRVAINVSGTELRESDYTTFLFSVIEESGLPASHLSLEIVESVILDDDKTGVASKLRQIRAAGVHLELDDFGTGYASLTHVNPQEIDRLKIDRRFVQNIDLDGDHAKIVRALAELARSLGISVVAEGAETEAELTALMTLGCDEVQGYAVAFPMPPTEARDWLQARMPRKSRTAEGQTLSV
ncbi:MULTISPECIES: EAL domain-containing protein [unclassified Aminobacter]|uniref:putative bifunctional diguanylate cyclase/phosphodiesterase n=1 Tax=unclassified Aminobacter TaxID=2644704 RepID=UPI000465781C|nr:MULTISPECIES: EAL domain-containing protein [unclassified Aminobacter]TWH34017.1 diguanylate cyclase (GGDEF)-like protein [Aminobacter sp. J15]